MRRRTLMLAAAVPAIPALPGPTLAQSAAKTDLVVDLIGDAATLDPHLQWDTSSYTVYRNIFDNLVTRDTAGTIVPQVGSSWRYSDDTTLVFAIREGITFHDGSKLTAEDVAYSISRVIDPALRSPQLSQFDQITSATVSGPNEVTLKTRTPYPALLAQLVKLSVVPKAYVERVGASRFNQEPVGSGPFKLRQWQRGVQTVLEANDAYWRGRPPFRTVTFRAVPDVPTRVADLRAGRADIVTGLTPDDAESLKNERGVQVLSAPTERVAFLNLNAQFGPTRDVRVRQAIAMAIDRNTLIEALQQGYAKPVNQVLTPANFGYTPEVEGWPYDPARARALLKEAGAEGATVTLISSPAYDRRLNEAVQQMLSEVGLKLNIEMMDQPTFLRRRQGNPEESGGMAQGRWSCACQDADGVIFPLFRTGSIWSKYSNPAFDTEVDAARATLDEAARRAHYKRAFEILRQDVPGIGLFQDVAIYGARNGLQWTPTANEAFFVMDMKWQG
ncbi:ABC transporter substrate-binding protein [Roseomonas sp. BN140053]|uniref:ABC transporter substrate-binding protein n=1 Tax=Roseomonas sp. BN140053 TaxID=3391898 RepID=UPI0039E7BBC3